MKKQLKQKENTQQGKWLPIIFFAGLFASGLFYVWSACLFTIAVVICLLISSKNSKIFIVPKGETFYACIIVVLFYGLSIIWAVDHGMAIIGFAKVICIPIFMFACEQAEPESRSKMLTYLPYAGAAMTVFSIVLGQIPIVHNYIFVNSRLSGFLQYSNTYALVLLCGIIILGLQTKFCWYDFASAAILIIGVLMSGSRTTFALMLLACIVIIIKQGNQKIKLTLLLAVGAILLISIIYVFVTGNTKAFGRFLTISLSSSTLLGRLLYWKDALPVIAGHPLGLGYLGYYYIQGAFQTGVYTVRYIHNELLQLLLDIGWLPVIAVVMAIARKILSKQLSLRNRMLIIAILLHSMMDFDFQFLSVFMILLLALEENYTNPTRKINKQKAIPVLCVASAICLYFAIPTALESLDAHSVAVKVYPLYTDAQVELLQVSETAEEMEKYADGILRVNNSSAIAYDAKAMVAFSEANFTDVIQFKEKAISLNRYDPYEYQEYIDMLVEGVALYMSHNDSQSEKICRQRIALVPKLIDEVQSETSPLAWKINQKPELALPNDYLSIVQEYGQ